MSASASASPAFQPRGNALQLTLATGAFAVCFAIFGSVSAMMPLLKTRLGLDAMQVSLAIALPVLLGSVGRIPLGILTDRYGGRVMFSSVMLGSIVPAVLMGFVDAYWQLLLCGFFIGVALASFSVGVGMVSGWYPPQRQGMALGVYGAGNIGQSLAAAGSPLLAGAIGYAWGFWTFALVTALWLAAFAFLGRNAPRSGPPRTVAMLFKPLADPRSWRLSTYYFLTFGGFVAMSIYLPMFLTGMFDLTPGDAGLRTAGFVVLATVMRPVGGVLADRVGGRVILRAIFPFIAVMAVFMACPLITTFTVGALGMAIAIGLGNGAVFKLVPQLFPHSVGAVTGLVGAAGGLGGFFPPLLIGAMHWSTGSYAWGFIPLSVFALGCFVLVWHADAGNRAAHPAAAPGQGPLLPGYGR